MNANMDNYSEEIKDIENQVCEHCILEFPKCKKKLCYKALESFYSENDNSMFPNGRDYDAEDW